MKWFKGLLIFLFICGNIACSEQNKEVAPEIIDIKAIMNDGMLDELPPIAKDSINTWFLGSDYMFYDNAFTRSVWTIPSIGQLFIVVTDGFEGAFLKTIHAASPRLLSGGVCAGPTEKQDTILWCEERVSFLDQKNGWIETIVTCPYSLTSTAEKIVSDTLSIDRFRLSEN